MSEFKFVIPRVVVALMFLVILKPSLCHAGIQEYDDLARQINLNQPAERIISLAPNITELLFHIGAGEQLVGADEYSNYPEDAKSLVRVNNHAMANYELILSLKPDIVFAWHSGNGDLIINRLRELGLKVFTIEIATMDQLPVLFEKLGRLTGNHEKGSEAASNFALRLDTIRQKYSKKKSVRTFYQIWDDPIMTFNQDHLVSDVIKLCGGINVFNQSIPLVPRVNIESVIDTDPEVILSSGSEDRVFAWRKKWQRWGAISAVKNDHLYLVPPDLLQRQSSRILDGASYVCDFIGKARQSND